MRTPTVPTPIKRTPLLSGHLDEVPKVSANRGLTVIFIPDSTYPDRTLSQLHGSHEQKIAVSLKAICRLFLSSVSILNILTNYSYYF